MAGKIRRSVTLAVVLTMVMGAFGSFQNVGIAATADDDATKYPKYTTEAGSIALEVEDAVFDAGFAKIEKNNKASKREYVKFTKANTKKPEINTPGMVGFDVTFDQEGRYAVWARYYVPDGGSNSIWMDYGGVVARTGEDGYLQVHFAEFSEDETDLRWKKVGTINMKAGQTHKIRLTTRESGCCVDKIIISKVMGYEPEGTGKLPNPDEAGKPAKMPENLYPIPTIKPPKEHPRVLFRASDIDRIKQNMQHPEMEQLVSEFERLKTKEYTGDLEDADPNYDAEGLEVIAAKALDYAFYGNADNGQQAISAIKNYAAQLNVASAGDNCRQEGHVLRIIGQVYDWCHKLLTPQDKQDLMFLAQSISAEMEVGFPPDLQSIICGHGGEAQLYRDWLSMAIACYDEYPDAYNMVMGKILSPESIEYRNWWNQSMTSSQGSSYGPETRYKAELYAHILIKRMCGEELFEEDNFVNTAYEWIYRLRPDGMLMIDGDDTNPNSIKKDQYLKHLKDAMFLASSINGDPILKREFFYEGGISLTYGRTAVQPIDMLLLNDPTVDTNTAIGTLPLTRYYPSPVGEMSARTGWNMGVKSNDVVATMTIGEYNPMNHGHYDSGHFMIYYKGILANDSGWYEQHSSQHHKGYASQSIAHNTLVIATDYNKWGTQNQGLDGPVTTNLDTPSGKNFYWIDDVWKDYQENKQNHWAELIGHEFGPDIQYPEYSYIAGDIANAYTSDYDDGVNEALRHMIFLPTGDEKNPAVFVVFDKIDTKVGGNKKSFLLHSEEEPQVSGNVTTIKRTERNYNGKLVNQTLLPDVNNLEIEKIGGTEKRFWNKGQNWLLMQDMGDTSRTVNTDNSLEAGWGRVEISPKTTTNIDYLLNVMYVGDADDISPVEKATLIETESFAGAKIFDRVVMFNKDKARTKDTVSFTVEGSEQALKVNVAGLKEGTWNISVNGAQIDTQIASEDGGIIYFTAPAGEYELVYASENKNKQFTKSDAPVLEGVTLYYNNNFLYSDVAPTIIDGRTLIPMRALLETMNAEVSWDEQTATATADDGYTNIVITENQKTAYVDGKPVELDVPAMIINGRFVIPVRFVAENLGAKVTWNDSAKRVEIEPPKNQKLLGIQNFIKIVASEQSGSEEREDRHIPSSYDGDFNSYWGVNCEWGDVWGIYDFGSVKTLDKVMLTFMQGAARTYKFDIEASEDGVNYTPVLTNVETSGKYGSGKLEPFELGGVQARYVKFKGYGNSKNTWNSMAEIVFTEKK